MNDLIVLRLVPLRFTVVGVLCWTLLWPAFRAHAQLNAPEPKESEEILLESLAHRVIAVAPADAEMARLLNTLGLRSYRKGANIPAHRYFLGALRISEKLRGPDHRDVARVLGHMAVTYAGIGLLDEGESVLRRAIAILELPGRGFDDSLVANVFNLAANLTMQDRLDEAEACYSRALDLAEQYWPIGDPRTRRLGEAFAGFYRMLGLQQHDGPR
jgi:tetratricopeptide (TPR) repeat protein